MYSECVEGAGHQGISDTDLHSRLFAKYYMKILPLIFFLFGVQDITEWLSEAVSRAKK